MNSLSAANTWKYALNNFRQAARLAQHAGTPVDHSVELVVAQVLSAIDGFVERPLLDAFGQTFGASLHGEVVHVGCAAGSDGDEPTAEAMAAVPAAGAGAALEWVAVVDPEGCALPRTRCQRVRA